VKFLKEFLTTPATTGAIVPSSSFLARTMIEGLSLPTAEAVLEYGPGTGVFTEFILRELSDTAKFAAIELNPRFAEAFQARFPKARLIQDSVANARRICDGEGIDSVDSIVSGLPWATFPESLQLACLDEMMRVLRPGGHFVTFAYIHGLALPPAKKFASVLPRYFSSVSKSPVVWLNLPPAFVYRCRR
jgi:phosphatidylethanolamine/phosphatidyl-N-methylethanolamine N-methyltransferase